MGMKVVMPRDLPLVDQGFVPMGVAARWGSYDRSSIHRAVARGALIGQRVGQRLYVDWGSFRSFVGGPVAATLPATAAQAVERWASC